MTPASGTLASPTPAKAADTAAAVPGRADGLQLLGQLEGSGYQHPRFLVRRSDGQTVHLTSLLYATLACIDGERTHGQIAQCLSDTVGRQVLDEDVRYLVDEKLRPLGLLEDSDGSQPSVGKTNPLLGLRFRFVLSNPQVTRRITRPFASLFRPFIAVPVLAAFAIASSWVLLEKGLASATHEALYQPGLLLLIVALTMVSAGFHEFGHAAACRYGGATPGAMGAGLYLVWPAFYTDVTDCYRLGRWGRVRVDVGGLYFNAIFAIGMFAVWAATRWDALLLIIPAQLLQMLRQLLPFVRFDGYHILADLTGVPDLFAHLKPTLLGLLPWRWRNADPRPLKRWARWVVTTWVVLVVPVLLFSLFMMVKVMPRVFATVWDSLGTQYGTLLVNVADGAWLDATARVLSIFALVLPAAAMVYLVLRIATRAARALWRQTDGRPVRRAAAVAAGALLVALVGWLWWPDGQYRPIQADERGSLLDVMPPSTPPSTLLPTPASLFAQPAADIREVTAGAAPPADVVAEPQLALVLTEAGETRPEQIVLLPPSEQVQPLDGADWPFPFNPPREARAQDNQAFALNTSDGSAVYDVALAMVWVRDGEVVDGRNDAYALASCSDCTTVAVAFQMIMVLGQSDVIVPQNVAVAVNYDCEACTTYALAVQLIATLTDTPSDAAMANIDAMWDELELFAAQIEDIPLDELRARLASFEAAILQVLAADEGASATVDSVEETASSGEWTATHEATEPTDDATATASPEIAATEQEDATAAPEPSPTAESDPEPTEEATEAPTETATP